MPVAKFVVGATVFALCGALAGTASAAEIDVNGSWQTTVDCGGAVVAVQTHRYDEDVQTGSLTLVQTGCGTLFIDGSIYEFLTCDQTPVVGQVTGPSIATPVTGYAPGYLTLNLTSPSICGGVPVVRVETNGRSDSTITDDGAGRGVRIDGLATGTSTVFDVNNNACWSNQPYSCSFVALRNDAPAGQNVSVAPLEGAAVTFTDVTESGTVVIALLTEPVATPPANFQLADLPIYYDVTTDAAINGPITVCLPYPDANGDGFVDGTSPAIDEDDLLLLHEEAGTYVNRTVSRDTVANQICAETTSLSQFVFGTSTVACGNAVLEGGEDCDAGAGLNGSSLSCCTASCTFRAGGEVCRPSVGECDGTSEMCSGSDGACPADVVVAAGVACTDDGNECRRDECDGFGLCSHPLASSTTPCTDDGNVCSSDRCDGAGACTHPSGPDGTSCDDALACNGVDRCVGGVCFHADGQCAAPTALDHYKCHKVKDLKNPAFTKIRDPGISLVDQFGADPDVDVLKPFMICNPADKNGSGISDPTAHLCCYKIKGRKVVPPLKQVETGDQFGTLQLEVLKPQLMCQPCSKTPLNF